jgi:nitrogen fixation protein NifU and related proteins
MLQFGTAAAMTTSPYDDLIMDHIKNARNYRALEGFDRRANGTNPLCGDEMLVALKLEGERISDVGFQCTCCGISMASASVMTEMVKGRSIEEASGVLREIVGLLNGSVAASGDALGAERLALLDTVKRFPARTRCAVLPWATLEAALNNKAEVVSVS